jgi:uncharacterized protein (DUF1501 family)
MISRREFLQNSSLIALAPSVPAFLAGTARAAAPKPDERILVIVQLSGGNDGINTVVPFADDGYAQNREKLRLAADRLHKLNDELALHPSMQSAKSLYDRGQLAIVQGVGYPNPNRSHDVSMAIWQSARLDREDHDAYGWIGRALDEDLHRPVQEPAGLLAGDEKMPLALRGRKAVVSSLGSLDDLKVPEDHFVPPQPNAAGSDDLAAFLTRQSVDAFATANSLKELAGKRSTDGSYPSTRLAGRLQLIATLIKAGLNTRVYYAIQPGYDTHSAQLFPHAQLLRELSEALKAFLDDLDAAGLSDRVLVAGFSEFGRRVKENGSAGTDHGTAGPMILAGGKLTPGVFGETPSLSDLDNGDVKHTIDFRQVYKAILNDWLKINPQSVVPGHFPSLQLFKTPTQGSR